MASRNQVGLDDTTLDIILIAVADLLFYSFTLVESYEFAPPQVCWLLPGIY